MLTLLFEDTGEIKGTFESRASVREMGKLISRHTGRALLAVDNTEGMTRHIARYEAGGEFPAMQPGTVSRPDHSTGV